MTLDPNSPQAGTPSLPSANSGPGVPTPTANASGAVEQSIDLPITAATASRDLSSLENDNTSTASTLSRSQTAQKQTSFLLILLLAIALTVVGITFDLLWLGMAGSLVALVLSVQVLWRDLWAIVTELMSLQQRLFTAALLGLFVAFIGLVKFTGLSRRITASLLQLDWDIVGSAGEVIGAVGQILIAVLAVYVAWRQYVISKDLTIQQNLITQQQTIDSYFQGISELVLDADGLLEDWPQERAIAEGRTAAILSSIDAIGKAKVIRFLSRSKLLTPLRRDRLLGRAILDGSGGYQEDRKYGVRVIDLGVMLAGTSLAKTDLRWTDLTDVNLIRVNLTQCDLVKANLARTILCEADLSGSDLQGARLFYGSARTATPRSRSLLPSYSTGEHTGAVVENADFTDVKRMSDEQRCYCCSWGGSKTRATIPGGCEEFPNLLGR